MGAKFSSPDQRFQEADLRPIKPWKPRFESGIFPYKFNIVLEIKKKNQWKSRLNALKDTNKLLVVEFTAKWCAQCKTLEPKLEELAAYKYTNVEFVKIDVDVLTSVWTEYDLHTFPAVVFMKRGKEVDRVVGLEFHELERKLHIYTQSF